MGGKPDSEIDTDEAKKIVQKLEDSFNSLYEAGEMVCTVDNPSGTPFGSPTDVQRMCNINSAQLGQGIPVCEQFATNTIMAYETLSGQYLSFAKSFETLINALRVMVENHEKGINEQTAQVSQAGSSTSYGTSSASTGNTNLY